MRRSNSKVPVWVVAAILACLSVPRASADITEVARCQKRIARAGARFATRVIRATLRCADAISQCQIECEQGVFGPPCENNPPPCCDPDDPGSNPAFGDCMAEADDLCATQTQRISIWEVNKQESIISVCQRLSQEELCGAEQPGLHFALLNAGCQALDPDYVCNLTNLVSCLGGPLERQLLDQISAVLQPRAGEAIAALGLEVAFPDIPVTRKVKGQVAEGKADIWAFDGNAGDLILVAVRNKNDNGDGTSNLSPTLTLLESDAQTPVADTTVRSAPCPYPNPCGSQCPQIKRSLPFSGTFHLALKAQGGGGCTGGGYKIILVTPGGVVPTLVMDDVDPAAQ